MWHWAHCMSAGIESGDAMELRADDVGSSLIGTSADLSHCTHSIADWSSFTPHWIFDILCIMLTSVSCYRAHWNETQRNSRKEKLLRFHRHLTDTSAIYVAPTYSTCQVSMLYTYSPGVEDFTYDSSENKWKMPIQSEDKDIAKHVVVLCPMKGMELCCSPIVNDSEATKRWEELDLLVNPMNLVFKVWVDLI
jgi:hypothetical protein